MKSPSPIGWLLVMGVVIAAATMFALSPREPAYQGKRLSEWLQDLNRLTFTKESHAQAVEAVRRIGTNGIPVLEKLLSSDSWFKRQVIEASRKQSLIKVRLQTADERRALAGPGIEALGPLAKPLIPRLIELLKEKSASAITGLAQIGPDAVLPLVQCLTNETPYVRSAAMISLSMIRPDNETALRAIVERLDDRDNRVRATAANALRSFWNKPEIVVPPLIKGLSDSDGTVRAQAAMTLGRFGAQAQTAIPALVKALEDENQSVRDAVVSALREIDTGGQLRAINK